MNILNFMQRFPDEASCIAYLKEQREQSGIVCKHCGCTEHRWDANKLVFECKHCHHRQSLRSGTVMEHSKLPFRYWIAAMFLLTSTKKSFSTEEIRRQLGHKRYQPIWEMMDILNNYWALEETHPLLFERIAAEYGRNLERAYSFPYQQEIAFIKYIITPAYEYYKEHPHPKVDIPEPATLV